MGVCLLAAAVSTACASGSVGSSVAPTSVDASASGGSASTSAVVTAAGDRGSRTPAQPPAAVELLRGKGVVSRVLEDTACPALAFEIEGDGFKVSKETRYDNGRCEDIEVGARVAWAGAKRSAETFVLVQRLKFAPLSR